MNTKIHIVIYNDRDLKYRSYIIIYIFSLSHLFHIRCVIFCSFCFAIIISIVVWVGIYHIVLEELMFNNRLNKKVDTAQVSNTFMEQNRTNFLNINSRSFFFFFCCFRNTCTFSQQQEPTTTTKK